MAIQYSLVKDDEGRDNLAVILDGEPLNIVSTHPSYDRVLSLVMDERTGEDQYEEIRSLINTADETLNTYLGELTTGRVSVRGNTVYFDGEPVKGNVINSILESFRKGDTASVVSLSRFLEKAMNNPGGQAAIDSMWAWMSERNFTVTEEGNFIAYKGVRGNVKENAEGKTYSKDEVFYSIHAGTATVNGKEYVNQQIPNKVGDVVTMPREKVNADPKNGCSYGLHVGTYAYARGYGNVMLAVEVDPADVVCVPEDAAFQKMRVCRYTIKSITKMRFEPEENRVVWGAMPYKGEGYDDYDYSHYDSLVDW